MTTTVKSPSQIIGILAPIMRQHLRMPWTWGWDNASTRAGQCSYRNHRITFSKKILPYLSEEEIRETALHEIGHMKAGHYAGHGPAWARAVRDIGGNPVRQLDVSHIGYKQTVNWVGLCPNGHRIERQRLSSALRNQERSCLSCSPQFSRDYLITWHKVA